MRSILQPGPAPNNIQLTPDGRLKHCLTTEGMPHLLMQEILDRAEEFITLPANEQKKIPLLRGKTVMNLFFENSTRTRLTFEIAAQRLGADVTNLDIRTSSTVKGESTLDTIRNLEAMNADIFVVRHSQAGTTNFIARHAAGHVSVLNAGDGRHSHPTQALLDMLTIRQYKGEFEPLKVAIVGDILHSRVARSQIHALHTMGTGEVRIVAPKTLTPIGIEELGVGAFHDIDEGLEDCDVVIMLRLQRERMENALLPSEREFFKRFGLTEKKLANTKPDSIVMHPGPINRGVEIDSTVAGGSRSVILPQVTNGIAIRMAVMSMVNETRQSLT